MRRLSTGDVRWAAGGVWGWVEDGGVDCVSVNGGFERP